MGIVLNFTANCSIHMCYVIFTRQASDLLTLIFSLAYLVRVSVPSNKIKKKIKKIRRTFVLKLTYRKYYIVKFIAYAIKISV